MVLPYSLRYHEAMPTLDFKKQDKNLYQPTSRPAVVNAPEMTFIMVDGEGNPNEPGGSYQQALEVLYALSYAIRMGGKKGDFPIPHYEEYVVPPLEGLWWTSETTAPADKGQFRWTSMIRQPGFVTRQVFDHALSSVTRKKKHLDVSRARFQTFTEGLCVQCMHTGPYDAEPATLALMHEFMERERLAPDVSGPRTHHEIYLSDPRKTAPDKLKTVLRIPVKPQGS